MAFLTNIFKNAKQNRLSKNCLQAAYEGDFKKALELLDLGADINVTGTGKRYSFGFTFKEPSTLGHAAVSKSNFKALTVLLEKGLDVNICAGNNPLVMHAIEVKNEAAAVALLARGADTSYVRSDLETPLSLAEANRMTEAVKLIMAQKQNSPALADPVTEAEVTAMKPLALKKSLSL